MIGSGLAQLPAALGAIWDFPLMPDRASTVAGRVDGIYWGLILLSGFFSILIAALLVFFAIKYRAGSAADRVIHSHDTHKHEVVWIGVPFLISMGLFVWSSSLFFHQRRMPTNALEISVIGKQWMWKTQHPSGRREINQLHVPIHTPVKLTMISQDVIHSFYIPAFRVKQDVLPGRYSTLWFEATMVGEFHLFCAEYCGADHSRMIGKVIVMTQADYQQWLATGNRDASVLSSGAATFTTLQCSTCHVPDSDVRAPRLEGLFGAKVKLQGGGEVVADEEYIRESILDPTAKIVDGYRPLMPTFSGKVTNEQLMELVGYIRSLQTPGGGGGTTGAGAASGAAGVKPEGSDTNNGGGQ
jgi:cytochrome c oxidase subunit II